MRPGRPKRMDAEYVRNGVAQIFVEVEPLTGKRHVEAAQHRTRKDWALWIKGMLVKRYPKAVKVRLILDNLNTHCLASLYETFKPKRLLAWQNAWKSITRPSTAVGSTWRR